MAAEALEATEALERWKRWKRRDAGSRAAPADAAAGGTGATSEMPKLPRPAPARDGAALDAAADAPAARAPRPGELGIDELLVNPTGDDLGREWIEIASLADEPLDLSQLHLATASTDVAAAAGTIAARALLLLGQSSDPSKNGGAPVSVAYGTKLILVNGDGQLSVCLGACASGVVLDTVSWGALGGGLHGPRAGDRSANQALLRGRHPLRDGRQLRDAGRSEFALCRKRRRRIRRRIAGRRFCCRLRRRRWARA